MQTNIELIFRAICSFYDGKYAHFTGYSIRNAVKEDALQDGIKALKTIGAIEDCTVNGCARRFKISNPIDCPDFIFDIRFDFRLKMYLLDRWNVNKSNENFVTKANFETKLQLLGTSTHEIISNSKPIHNKIEVPDTMYIEETESGYKIKVKPIPKEIRDRHYECRYCGDTNPEHFGAQHTCCKKCYNALDRNRRSYAERLYRSSKANARNQHHDHTITMDYIQELLDKQDYKCCYSGIPFYNDRHDKFTYPTIDRIDSSKGYIEGNVCICTWLVNTMKSNLTINQFKDLITKIYNNKDNF